MNNSFNDIVITGSAVISAAGIGVAAVQELVNSGGDALTDIPADILGSEGYRWGKTTGFTVSSFMPPMKARKMDRCSQFAVIASGMAFKDAALEAKSLAPERLGISLGSGFCGVSTSAEFLTGYFTAGVEGLIPMIFPNTVPNAPASNASIEHGFKGPNVTLVQRFCSAESALLHACRYIQEGRADVMLTGGVDDLMPLLVKGFAAFGQLTRSTPPFGEGCGILVLENLAHARARGARILATVESVRSLGMLVAGREQEGIDLLTGPMEECRLVSISGCAADVPEMLKAADGIPRIEVGRAIGRSLAMGGTALATLVASLAVGERGVHIAASPEGPCFSLSVRGGSPA